MRSTDEKYPLIPFLFASFRKPNLPDDISKLKESYKQIRWALLFIDLMFVGVVYNVDNIIVRCGQEWLVYFVSYCYFIVMFNTRYQMDFYSSTYRSFSEKDPYTKIPYSTPLFQNDLWHHFIVVMYGLGLYLSTLNISHDLLPSDENGDYGNCNFNPNYVIGFCLGFMLSRTMIVSWNIIFLFTPVSGIYRGKYFVDFFCRGVTACISSIIVFPAFFNPTNLLISLPLVAVLDFVIDPFVPKMVEWFRKTYPEHQSDDTKEIIEECQEMVTSKVEKFKQSYIEVKTPDQAKPDTIYCGAEELLERLGFIFMLVLGEGVIGFSLLNYQTQGAHTWLSQIFSFLLLVSTGMLFYETVDVVQFDEDRHALVNGVLYRVPFYILHLAASLLMLTTICGMIELYEHAGNAISNDVTVNDSRTEHDSPQSSLHIDLQWNSWLMAIGLCLMEVCLFLMRILHGLSSWHMRLTYCLSIIAHFTVFFITKAANCTPDGIIVTHSVITLCTNVLRMIIDARIKLERNPPNHEYELARISPSIDDDNDAADDAEGVEREEVGTEPSIPSSAVSMKENM